MHAATKKIHFGLPVLAVASALMLVATPASSGGPGAFVIDHYLTYSLLNTFLRPAGIITVTLTDQFVSEADHELLSLDRFALPVDKNQGGIIDAVTHYTWWSLGGNLGNPVTSVAVRNQFGNVTLDVGDAVYLLAPTTKNLDISRGPPRNVAPDEANGPGLPPDHYKCYQAVGDAIDLAVGLTDQFSDESHSVLEPRYLCNPVEKRHAGVTFSINNPNDHLVCYSVTGGIPLVIQVTSEDQFGPRVIDLTTPELLCVPSEKEIPTQASEGSWGKVKSIYR